MISINDLVKLILLVIASLIVYSVFHLVMDKLGYVAVNSFSSEIPPVQSVHSQAVDNGLIDPEFKYQAINGPVFNPIRHVDVSAIQEEDLEEGMIDPYHHRPAPVENYVGPSFRSNKKHMINTTFNPRPVAFNSPTYMIAPVQEQGRD